MKGSPDAAAALTRITRFLAFDNWPSAPVELVVLCGNAVLATTLRAAEILDACPSSELLISGGTGHSTPFLMQSIAASRFRDVPTMGMPESKMLRAILVELGIHPARIKVEVESTNCGANAIASRDLLREQGSIPRSLLVLQDPTMQLRSFASFQKAWEGIPTDIFSDPSFTPEVLSLDGELLFRDETKLGLWPMERFASLALGEIPRLRNDANGYGPKGKGFIGPVEIPSDVEQAWRTCMAILPPDSAARAG